MSVRPSDIWMACGHVFTPRSRSAHVFSMMFNVFLLLLKGCWCRLSGGHCEAVRAYHLGRYVGGLSVFLFKLQPPHHVTYFMAALLEMRKELRLVFVIWIEISAIQFDLWSQSIGESTSEWVVWSKHRSLYRSRRFEIHIESSSRNNVDELPM